MFQAHKEIIWHITCEECKYYFSHATMMENEKIDRRDLHCPSCGKKQPVIVYKDLEKEL